MTTDVTTQEGLHRIYKKNSLTREQTKKKHQCHTMVLNLTKMIEDFLSERKAVKYDKESKTYWLVAIHRRSFHIYSDFQT